MEEQIREMIWRNKPSQKIAAEEIAIMMYTFIVWKDEKVGLPNRNGIYLYWENHFSINGLFEYWFKNIYRNETDSSR